MLICSYLVDSIYFFLLAWEMLYLLSSLLDVFPSRAEGAQAYRTGVEAQQSIPYMTVMTGGIIDEYYS